MAGIARTVTEREHLRKVAFPAYRAYARAMVFYPGPRVLATSMPKAGTHLLSSLLKNFPRLMFSGRHHALRNFRLDTPTDSKGRPPEFDWRKIERTLASVNKGQFMTAHFAPLPELIGILERLEYKTVNIMRDPRDVVVSSAHYLTHLERHFLHERMKTEFSSVEDRLMAVISGLPPDASGRGLPSVAQRISRYRQWIGQPNTFECRFERLIGARGGGSDDEQINEIASIGDHIGRPLTAHEASVIAARTWSPRSSTFRKGMIGDWRNHFKDEHKAAFKDLAGEELVALGYERDLNW